MIRILLSLAAVWWLCFFMWPLATLVVYALVLAAAAREARRDWWPRAQVRR